MKIEYQLSPPNEFDAKDREVFAEMLGKQGKVRGELAKKADRCKLICVVRIDRNIVAIGGIKPKTSSDFSKEKAGVPELSNEFEWELGYLYTDDPQRGQGFGSNVARLLIEAYGRGNLMASTEMTANKGMVRILERLGFRLFGKPWRSGIHGNHLGLFLKFE